MSEISALAELLAEHADCVANDSRSREWIDGSGMTGIDVWSCGLEVPFVDDFDAMQRAHLATAIAPLLAEVRRTAAKEALTDLADDIDPTGYGWTSVVDAERFKARLRERAARIAREEGRA